MPTTTEHPPASVSSVDTDAGSDSRRPTAESISVQLPHNLLVLPPTAALVGLVIGMSRGGSRARLRFLAENAHRPPTTIQGWYFYTKTRNYRVFYAAATTGARYALGLGGAVAAYCVLDECMGWAREKLGEVADHGIGMKHPSVRDPRRAGVSAGSAPELERRRTVAFPEERGSASTSVPGVSEQGLVQDRWSGWRSGPVHWEDGAFAGLIMGAAVGFAFSLPRPLFVRSLLMGSLLGGSTSALQVAQAKVGRLRDEQLQAEAVSVSSTAEGALKVDRAVEPSPALDTVPVDETLPSEPIAQVEESFSTTAATPEPSSGPAKDGEGWSSWNSWIPGSGK